MNPLSLPAPSLSNRLPPQDETLGLAWWNALSWSERACALQAAENALGRAVSVADAWLIWKRTTAGAGGADRFAVLIAPSRLTRPSA